MLDYIYSLTKSITYLLTAFIHYGHLYRASSSCMLACGHDLCLTVGVFVYMRVCAFVFVCVSVCACVSVCVCYACLCVYVSVWICVYMYVCMCVCLCVTACLPSSAFLPFCRLRCCVGWRATVSSCPSSPSGRLWTTGWRRPRTQGHRHTLPTWSWQGVLR